MAANVNISVCYFVYSSIFKDILNDPSVAFSFQVPTVSVPGTFSCLSMLLKILVKGKAIANEDGYLKEVTELANVLGIGLRNIIFDQFVFDNMIYISPQCLFSSDN